MSRKQERLALIRQTLSQLNQSLAGFDNSPTAEMRGTQSAQRQPTRSSAAPGA